MPNHSRNATAIAVIYLLININNSNMRLPACYLFQHIKITTTMQVKENNYVTIIKITQCRRYSSNWKKYNNNDNK